MGKFLIIMLMVFSITGFAESLYKPDNQQALDNFTKFFIKQGADKTLKGKNTNPFLLNVVTSSKVIADYKTNQLKANKTYEGKYTRLQTVANRIDAGVFNSPFIVSHGKNQFEDILIYINPNDERFLEIKAGDKIDLICKGKGYQLVSPAFNNCLFTKDYIEKASSILIANLSKASNDNYKPTSLEEFKIIFVYIYGESFFEKSCAVSVEECSKNLNDKIGKEEPKQSPKEKARAEAITNAFTATPLKSILYQF